MKKDILHRTTINSPMNIAISAAIALSLGVPQIQADIGVEGTLTTAPANGYSCDDICGTFMMQEGVFESKGMLGGAFDVENNLLGGGKNNDLSSKYSQALDGICTVATSTETEAKCKSNSSATILEKGKSVSGETPSNWGSSAPTCAKLQEIQFQCKGRNDLNLKTQCASYELNKAAKGEMGAAFWIDLAAATACTASCAAEYIPLFGQAGAPALEAACAIAGGAASVAEMVGMMNMQDNSSYAQLARMTGAMTAGGAAFAGGAITKSGSTGAKWAACLSAAFYTTFTTLRYIHIGGAEERRDAACGEAKKEFATNINTIKAGAASGDSTNTSATALAVSAWNPNIPNGGTGKAQLGSARTNNNTIASGSQIISPDSSSVNAAMANTPEGQVMNNKELGNISKQVMGTFDQKAILDRIKSQGLDATLTSMLGTNGATMVGLAKEMRENEKMKDFLGQHSNSEAYSSAGGAKAAGGKTNSGSNFSFGSLTPVGTGPAETEFSKKSKSAIDPSSDDIWHEQFKGTIFEVVSFRLKKTNDRVDQLEWTTPLNRALNGLSNKVNTQTAVRPIQNRK